MKNGWAGRKVTQKTSSVTPESYKKCKAIVKAFSVVRGKLKKEGYENLKGAAGVSTNKNGKETVFIVGEMLLTQDPVAVSTKGYEVKEMLPLVEAFMSHCLSICPLEEALYAPKGWDGSLEAMVPADSNKDVTKH